MTMVLDPPRVETELVQIVVASGCDGAFDALSQTLDALFDEVELSEAGTLAALGRALGGQRPPDLVLVDLALPKIGGLPGLLYLRAQNPDVPIAVVSSMRDRAIMRRAVEVGAAGFVPHDADAPMLREAIRGMLDGEIWTSPDFEQAGLEQPGLEQPGLEQPGLDLSVPLDAAVAEPLRRLSSLTPQQLRVLTMLAQGLLNKQVAYELGVSEATVKAHVSAILQKLGVDGRAQAVATVRRLEGGWFTRDPSQR